MIVGAKRKPRALNLKTLGTLWGLGSKSKALTPKLQVSWAGLMALVLADCLADIKKEL